MKGTKEKEVFLVYVSGGRYEDYYQRSIFVTASEDKAQRWVERFNHIIETNDERWNEWWNNEREYKELLWGEWYIWDKPVAFYQKVEER